MITMSDIFIITSLYLVIFGGLFSCFTAFYWVSNFGK